MKAAPPDPPAVRPGRTRQKKHYPSTFDKRLGAVVLDCNVVDTELLTFLTDIVCSTPIGMSFFFGMSSRLSLVDENAAENDGVTDHDAIYEEVNSAPFGIAKCTVRKLVFSSPWMCSVHILTRRELTVAITNPP